MEKKTVAIVGASGYTGQEAVKLLSRHPHAVISACASNNNAGQPISSLMGPNVPDITFCKTTDDEVMNADVIFCCLPHCTAAERVKEWREVGKTVIDFSADFRLKDPAVYKEWYGHTHPAPELISEAVYGLPEVNREKIKETDLVANPGCYPTATALGLIPAFKEELIDPSVIVNAVSGVSGAGRQSKVEYSFVELDGSMNGYGAPRHRHTPEMEQTLYMTSGQSVKVSFVPHLGNFSRGIYATLYGKLLKDVSQEEVQKLYAEYYSAEPFVKVTNENPKLANVVNTNYCHMKPVIDPRTGTLVVFSAIDNLVKGAAGQAVQCFNIRFGFEETEGLL